jgi:hypothetical protein
MKILRGQFRDPSLGSAPVSAPGSSPGVGNVARSGIQLRGQLREGGGEEANKKGRPVSKTTLEMYKDFARNGILMKS